MANTVSRIEGLKQRTKSLAIRVIKLVQALPKTEEARVIGRQLLRSATSVGSNYRAVARNKSEADKLNKLKIVLEEADETEFWLDLLAEAEILEEERLQPLKEEYNEIIRMISTSIQNIKRRTK